MKKETLSTKQAAIIADALQQRHRSYMKENESFEVEGFRSKTEVYIQVALRNHDESFYYPVECKLDPRLDSLQPEEAEELLLDFLDYYFSRYLREDRDVFVTIDWSMIEFDDISLMVKGQILNRKLETMADQLLSNRSNGDV